MFRSSFLLLILSVFAGAADALPDFQYTLSCTETVQGPVTIMIQVKIEYDGRENTCRSSKSEFMKGASECYEIPFKCNAPKLVSADTRNPFQLWTFEATEAASDKISKLVLVMNHGTEQANGFATSPDGVSLSLTCKKW